MEGFVNFSCMISILYLFSCIQFFKNQLFKNLEHFIFMVVSSLFLYHLCICCYRKPKTSVWNPFSTISSLAKQYFTLIWKKIKILFNEVQFNAKRILDMLDEEIPIDDTNWNLKGLVKDFSEI